MRRDAAASPGFAVLVERLEGRLRKAPPENADPAANTAKRHRNPEYIRRAAAEVVSFFDPNNKELNE